MSTGGEIIEVLQPVSLDAAVADSRTVNEGQVNKMMQACRQENAFREGVSPDAEDAAGLEEELELFDTVLDRRPDVTEEERAMGSMTRKPTATTKAGPLKMPSQSGISVS